MEYKIYKLTSPSGKVYIGQTKTTLEIRFKQHIQAYERYIKDEIVYKSKLYEAFKKYPPDTWTKEIIDYAPDQTSIDLLEQQYILEYNSTQVGYNILNGGQGFRRDYLEEDHKENISSSRKEFFKTEEGQQWKETLSEMYSGENNPMYGKTFNHTDETKLKMSTSCKGKNKGKVPWNKGKTDVYSNETLEKMSKNRTGKGLGRDNSKNMKGKNQSDHQKETISKVMSKDWLVVDPYGNEYEITNLRQFCKEHGLGAGNIQRGGSKRWKAYKINR